MAGWNIVHAKPLSGYRLDLTFADGLQGRVDLSGVPHTGIYTPWADPAFFAQAKVDACRGTVVWPNGADLPPYVLYAEVMDWRVWESPPERVKYCTACHAVHKGAKCSTCEWLPPVEVPGADAWRHPGGMTDVQLAQATGIPQWCLAEIRSLPPGGELRARRLAQAVRLSAEAKQMQADFIAGMPANLCAYLDETLAKSIISEASKFIEKRKEQDDWWPVAGKWEFLRCSSKFLADCEAIREMDGVPFRGRDGLVPMNPGRYDHLDERISRLCFKWGIEPIRCPGAEKLFLYPEVMSFDELAKYFCALLICRYPNGWDDEYYAWRGAFNDRAEMNAVPGEWLKTSFNHSNRFGKDYDELAPEMRIEFVPPPDWSREAFRNVYSRLVHDCDVRFSRVTVHHDPPRIVMCIPKSGKKMIYSVNNFLDLGEYRLIRKIIVECYGVDIPAVTPWVKRDKVVAQTIRTELLALQALRGEITKEGACQKAADEGLLLDKNHFGRKVESALRRLETIEKAAAERESVFPPVNSRASLPVSR